VAQTTRYGRGTGGYRAPELIDESTCKTRYTNKVDIFALGCIFFELVFGMKSFESDFQVHRYSQNPREKLMPPTTSYVYLDERSQKSVSQTILRMIDVDQSKRPSATQLQKELHYSLRRSPSTSSPTEVRTPQDHDPVVSEDSIDLLYFSQRG